MDIDSRQELEKATNDLVLWADRYKDARIAYGKSFYQLSILLAAENITDRMSFDNKVLKMMSEEETDVVKNLWKVYTEEYHKYKSAELMWKSIESKVNSIKFINRLIT